MNSVPLKLTPEEEAALIAQARTEGISIESLVHKAVLQVIAARVGSALPVGEQWEREFEDWLNSLQVLPTLSDEAISRESIYTREDEWR